MLTLRVLYSTVLLVASCSWAAVTPVIDISVAGRAPLVPAMYPKVTHYYSANGTELAVIKATDNISTEDIAALQPLVNDQVITSAFETVAKITEVVCMTAGPIACVTTGIIAVLGVFFALYQLGGRELSDHVFNLEYPPVPGCGARCRLELDAPEGDWRPVGMLPSTVYSTPSITSATAPTTAYDPSSSRRKSTS